MLPTNHEIMERRLAQGATDALAAREAQEARDAARLALWPEMVAALELALGETAVTPYTDAGMYEQKARLSDARSILSKAKELK